MNLKCTLTKEWNKSVMSRGTGLTLFFFLEGGALKATMLLDVAMMPAHRFFFFYLCLLQVLILCYVSLPEDISSALVE